MTAVLNVGLNKLYWHFSGIADANSDDFEFYIAHEDGEPVGFACWHKKGWPYTATVFCEHIYSRSENKEVAKALIKEFLNFGAKNKAIYFSASALNKKLYEHYKTWAEEFGYNMNETHRVDFIATKKE